MQAEPARVRLGLLGQLRLDEHLGATAPDRAQAVECGTVFVPARGQLRVGLGNVDRFRALRWPLIGPKLGRGTGARGKRAFGMVRPRSVRTIVVDPRVDLPRTLARLIRCADDDLNCDTGGFNDERGLQDKLVYPRAPDTVSGGQHELYNHRTRPQYDPVHFVVGQPRMGRERQTASENGLI